jgi:antitoxin (DNA-binding transcriptional repressor) of toxin-antitoxin stability system
MTKIISIKKATEDLPNIVEKLRSGSYIILQKKGRPIAGILDVDDMEDFLELQNSSLKIQIKSGYKEFKKDKTVSGRSFLQSLRKNK